MVTEERPEKLVECRLTITYADGRKVEWTTTTQNVEKLLQEDDIVKMIIRKRDA